MNTLIETNAATKDPNVTDPNMHNLTESSRATFQNIGGSFSVSNFGGKTEMGDNLDKLTNDKEEMRRYTIDVGKENLFNIFTDQFSNLQIDPNNPLNQTRPTQLSAGNATPTLREPRRAPSTPNKTLESVVEEELVFTGDTEIEDLIKPLDDDMQDEIIDTLNCLRQTTLEDRQPPRRRRMHSYSRVFGMSTMNTFKRPPTRSGYCQSPLTPQNPISRPIGSAKTSSSTHTPLLPMRRAINSTQFESVSKHTISSTAPFGHLTADEKVQKMELGHIGGMLVYQITPKPNADGEARPYYIHATRPRTHASSHLRSRKISNISIEVDPILREKLQMRRAKKTLEARSNILSSTNTPVTPQNQ